MCVLKKINQQCPNYIYLARSRFISSRILFNKYENMHSNAHSCAPLCVSDRKISWERESGRKRERRKDREILVGADPIIHSGSRERERGTCPQAVGRTGHRDFSPLSLSRRASNPPREDVSNRFFATRLQVVLRMAFRELPCVIPLIRVPA